MPFSSSLTVLDFSDYREAISNMLLLYEGNAATGQLSADRTPSSARVPLQCCQLHLVHRKHAVQMAAVL